MRHTNVPVYSSEYLILQKRFLFHKMVYIEENMLFILNSLMCFIVSLLFVKLQYNPEGKFEKSVKVNLAVISKFCLL